MSCTEQIFKGIRFNLLQKGHYQWVDHPGAAVILPLLDNEEIVMIRNYRIAIDQELWELPAGTLEPHEPPLETAYRELEEETGYKACEMELLLSFYPSPGINNELLHAYVAKGLIQTAQNLDEGEQIQVEVMPLSRALEMIGEGKIQDAKTITTLLYYDRFKN